MIDLAALTSLATPLREWLAWLKTDARQEEQHYQEALESLYTALNETRIYIGSLARARNKANANSGRNEETEAKLSRLWTKTSVKISPFDYDLARRCLMKGDYWADPDAWDERDIRRARIEIERVFRDARALL